VTESLDGHLPDAKTMAALMAAVQMYLEAEATEVPAQNAPGRSAWKTATWGIFRAEASRRRSSWNALRRG
jgi:hypothetical protein